MRLMIVFIACTMLAGCPLPRLWPADWEDTYTQSEQRDVDLVSTRLQDAGLWKGSGVAVFEMGPLRGGTAVLYAGYWEDLGSRSQESEVGACFWVKDGVVYAVDDDAKKIAPDLASAPTGITETGVRSVVH
jgi:hypothetical protein